MDNQQSTKDAALAVSLAIQNDEWDTLDGLLADGFTYSGDGLVFNKDEYIGFMQDMKSAFSGMKMEFKHVLVDGEFVTINFSSKAKNVGKFMGAPATKKNIEVNGTLIRQMRNGIAIQEWQTTDLLGLMTQMGFGALFGYAVAIGLFKVKPKKPVRK
ncbi:MAG: SnoaL-like domain-containing protein [Methylococcaceae bacterium]|nr:SnoaL-like domain-containing protein [Methylococcaceae bacterium]